MATTNTDRLKALMEKHNLRAKDVAEILDRTPKTVRMWRSIGCPDIPNALLKLLEMELRGRDVPDQPELPMQSGADE